MSTKGVAPTTEEPTFPICRGCPEYTTCQGGHHDDCETDKEAAIDKALGHGMNV